MTIGIYGIINETNNLIYIGESNNIERRWEEHIDDLNNNSHCNYKLQTAWNTYGKDNIRFELLEEIQSLDSPYKTTMQLIYLEGKYIDQYNSIINGYNIENTVEKVLSGSKVIISKNIDAKYLYNLIRNNGVDASFPTNPKKEKIKLKLSNRVLNNLDTYSKLKLDGYKMKFPQDKLYEELFIKGIFTKSSNRAYYVKDEYINQGYFENGRKKKYKDGSINYVILITEKGRQLIIDTLELKSNKIK